MTELTYSTAQLARKSGVTLRQIQYWREAGLIRPSIRYGNAYVYSELQLRMVNVIARVLYVWAQGGFGKTILQNIQPVVRLAGKHSTGYLLVLIRRSNDGQRGLYTVRHYTAPEKMFAAAVKSPYGAVIIDLEDV